MSRNTCRYIFLLIALSNETKFYTHTHTHTHIHIHTYIHTHTHTFSLIIYIYKPAQIKTYTCFEYINIFTQLFDLER